MTKKALAIAAAALMAVGTATAQSPDPTIMEVGGERISRSEFMQEFNNNVGNRMRASGATADEQRKAMLEYVDLYANFRAKLLDAHKRGIDGTPSLLAELKKYRTELAQPYLIDSAELDRLMREAYERNHYSLHAAHILVSCAPDAAPADSMKAYAQALSYSLRARGGEDFYRLASEQVHQQNPTAPMRDNEGDLGYFTAFDMVYPFENAAYALQVGEVSSPVRTRYGYHVIKLLDRVPLSGKMDVAHIWLSSPDSLAARGQIRLLYEQVRDGHISFEQAALSSDDQSTRRDGGMLRGATLSMLPPEYIERLVGMKDGEMTQPFYTKYGWHILKMVKHSELALLDEMVPYYKQRLARDQRGEDTKRAFARKCRERYGIVDNTVTPAPTKGKKGRKGQMVATLGALEAAIPADTLLRGRYHYNADRFATTTPLVQTPTGTYDERDVAQYIAAHQRMNRNNKDIKKAIRTLYDNFLDSVTLVYADSRLEADHPEFAKLIDEYHHGLTIFDYNEKMIWSKAIQDSVGFAAYYARASRTKSLSNPDDSVFFWHERARVSIIDIADSNVIGRSKLQKLLEKAWHRSAGSSEMAEIVTKAISDKKGRAACAVTADVELVEKGHQQLLAADQWQRGVYIGTRGRGYHVLVVDELLPPSLKEQMSARGYYLNEYQNEVEQRLNEELRKQYRVKIHRDVVESIKF